MNTFAQVFNQISLHDLVFTIRRHDNLKRELLLVLNSSINELFGSTMKALTVPIRLRWRGQKSLSDAFGNRISNEMFDFTLHAA